MSIPSPRYFFILVYISFYSFAGMIYRVIGIMSGSSLDGLDIVFTELGETGGQWYYDIKHAETIGYPDEWVVKLKHATGLSAVEYLRLHAAYGRFIGERVNDFIEKYNLQHQVQLISSHGHTVFHEPVNRMTAQLGDGAAIAAVTGVNVVSDLRAMDMALGGQGAPIVPMGEKLLLSDYALLLNLGGIANISAATPNGYIAFDICPANRVLNMLAADAGLEYDKDGLLASKGFVRDEVLAKMNQQPYYTKPFPKSLANDFGTDVIYPMLKQANLSVPDALRSMVEHISIQHTRSLGRLLNTFKEAKPGRMLVTGGGAHNIFLMERLQASLGVMGITLDVPEARVIDYKEALIMALLGIQRWREENTVIHSATGASRSSIGGAVWIGQEA
jgi:anhydro-N-acetylmuramic acid kinase